MISCLHRIALGRILASCIMLLICFDWAGPSWQSEEGSLKSASPIVAPGIKKLWFRFPMIWVAGSGAPAPSLHSTATLAPRSANTGSRDENACSDVGDRIHRLIRFTDWSRTLRSEDHVASSYLWQSAMHARRFAMNYAMQK